MATSKFFFFAPYSFIATSIPLFYAALPTPG